MNDLVRQESGIESLIRASELLAKGHMFPHPAEKRPLNQAEVFSIVEYGHELGMPPVAALMNIVPVQGRLCTSAACMLGVAVNHGTKYRIVSESDTGCEIYFERGNIKYTSKFTRDDARQAGLLNKTNWQNYPVDMYRARAIARGCRFVVPDKLAGLYTKEELGSGLTEDDPDINLTAKLPSLDITADANPGEEIISPEMNTVSKEPAFLKPMTDLGKKMIDKVLEYGNDEPLVTEKQIKAIYAIIGSMGMRNMEDILKDYLLEIGMLPMDKSWHNMKRDDASRIISDSQRGKFLTDFLFEIKYHDELKTKFASSKKTEKLNLLLTIAPLIDDIGPLPSDITKELNDKQMIEYFSLFLMAIHNEEMNRRSPDAIVTIDEVKRTFNAKDVTDKQGGTFPPQEVTDDSFMGED